MATNIYGGSADIQERQVETQATQDVYNALKSAGIEPGFAPGSYGAMDPTVRAQYLNAIRGYGAEGQFGPSSQVPETSSTSDFIKLLSMFGGGAGSGSSNKLTTADVDLRELQYKKAQDAAALARQKAAEAALLDYYQGGAYTSVDPDILAKIQSMASGAKGDVEAAYNKSIGNIGQAYADALGLSEQGYAGLEQYLAETPNDPYAGLTARTGTVTNPMEALLSAYGVGAEPVRAQVAAEQLAGQQGGQAFQDLINVLSAASQQAGKSRVAESKMGREASKRTLAAQQAGLKSQAETAMAQALAQIAERQRQQEFEQELSTIAARKALEEELLKAGVNPKLTPTERIIRASGGTTSQSEFEQGVADLAAALGGIGFQG